MATTPATDPAIAALAEPAWIFTLPAAAVLSGGLFRVFNHMVH